MRLRLANKSDWTRLVEYVKTLTFVRDGKQVTYRVTIEEIKPTRSIEQNSRCWALVTAISQQAPAHMGGEWHSPEIWWEYFAKRFLGMEAGPFGDGVRKRTRNLKVGEFSDWMQEIEAWAYQEIPGFNFEWEQAA